MFHFLMISYKLLEIEQNQLSAQSESNSMFILSRMWWKRNNPSLSIHKRILIEISIKTVQAVGITKNTAKPGWKTSRGYCRDYLKIVAMYQFSQYLPEAQT